MSNVPSKNVSVLERLKSPFVHSTPTWGEITAEIERLRDAVMMAELWLTEMGHAGKHEMRRTLSGESEMDSLPESEGPICSTDQPDSVTGGAAPARQSGAPAVDPAGVRQHSAALKIIKAAGIQYATCTSGPGTKPHVTVGFHRLHEAQEFHRLLVRLTHETSSPQKCPDPAPDSRQGERGPPYCAKCGEQLTEDGHHKPDLLEPLV